MIENVRKAPGNEPCIVINTAQKMKFFMKDFFSKCGFGHLY